MADDGDAARASLFGGASSRAGRKPNPYADVPSGEAPSAAAPSATSAASNVGAGFDPLDPSDVARHALLAGGKKKPSAAAAAADAPHASASQPPPSQQTAAVEPLDDDDGGIDFDFEGLNMTAGIGSSPSRGGGRGGVDGDHGGATSGSAEELNFDEIDSDLSHFSADPVIREALSRGVDLRLYARQVDHELRSMEMLSIADYIAESDAIAGLFEQIVSCETVLNDMQGMLQSFQDNLGGISNEIRSLQEQSLSMSVRMSNRKALQAKVKGFLAKVAVPEGLIDRIVEAPIDEAWMRDLRALGEKVAFTYGQANSIFARPAAAAGLSSSAAAATAGVTAALTRAPGTAVGSEPSSAPAAAAAVDPEDLSDLTVSPFQTPAGKEALPAIEKLKTKAVARLREHFIRAIGELVKPKTSMQKQQEYVLLKVGLGMAFLTEFAPEAAREVRSVYAETVGRSMGDVFKRYHDDLAKALLPVPAKGETVLDYSGKLVTSPGSAIPLPQPGQPPLGVNPFVLSPDRLAAVERAADAPVAGHVVQAERLRMSFEAAFRSLQRHLCDVAAAEDSFDRRFFGDRYGPEVFGLVMSRSLNVMFAALEEAIGHSSDAPGLLLLLAITAAHRKGMADRKLTCLEPYFDRVVMLLWPRFKSVLDANVASIRAAKEQPRRLLQDGATAGTTGCLPVTSRYAELVAGILVLHRQLAESGASDAMLPVHISTFGREFEAALSRLASETLPSKTARTVFLINQWATVWGTAVERRVHPEDAAPFEAQLKAQTESYVDGELDLNFRSLRQFVTSTEAAAVASARAAGVAVPDKDEAGRPRVGLPEGVPVTASVTDVEGVLRDFGQSWRGGLKGLHDGVLRNFPDPRAGVAVLKACMGSFVGLYERFHAILTRAFPPTAPFLREVVPTPTIFYEIKRYSRAFEGQ